MIPYYNSVMSSNVLLLEQKMKRYPLDLLFYQFLNIIFDLSVQVFRDALAIRYKKPLLGAPANCDGCGAPLIYF